MLCQLFCSFRAFPKPSEPIIAPSGGGAIEEIRVVLPSCDYDYNETHYCVVNVTTGKLEFIPKIKPEPPIGKFERFLLEPIKLPSGQYAPPLLLDISFIFVVYYIIKKRRRAFV